MVVRLFELVMVVFGCGLVKGVCVYLFWGLMVLVGVCGLVGELGGVDVVLYVLG